MRLIDADARMIAVEQEFEGVCVYDVPPSEAVSDFERIVDSMPTIEGRHSFDIDANVILDATFGKDQPLFHETDEMCPRCQRDLEVYYCENRTYAVRCKHCKMVTIVQARSPYEAAEKVGLHVKPVRHGRWELETSKYLCRCSACEKVTFYRGVGRHYDYCPNCGAKMRGDEDATE